jgi:DNA-binding CsgD family transcriptional regulator/tetratricopeptide (TPR) repeat protein
MAGVRAGSVLLVSGEPGVGKTRFASELKSRFAATGGRVAAGTCLDFLGTPLASLEDVFFQLGIADELGSPQTTPPAALVRALARIAAQQPTMIVLDDLHSADLATIDFLGFLAERIGESPLFLVCTYRTRSHADGAPLTLALARLARARCVERLELGALSNVAMRRLIGELSGGIAALDSATVGSIRDLSEGNPLYAEELLDQALRQGNRETIAVPFSLAGVILERFSAFGGEERATLSQAAVLGKAFDVPMLAAISERPVSAIRTMVRNARDAGILSEDPGGDRLSFRHALIREALYESLLASEARELHRRSAEHLEASGAAEDVRCAELAYHFWAAGDGPKAIAFNEEVGNRSMRAFAPKDAARFYARALDFAAPGSETQTRLLHRLGEAYALGGFPDRARVAFEKAFRALSGERRGSERAELALVIADQCSNQPAIGRPWEWLEIGLAEARSQGDAATIYRALCGLVLDAVHRCDFEAFEEHVAQAEASRRENESRAHARYLTAKGLADVMRGDVDSAQRRYREAVAFGDATGELIPIATARLNSARGLAPLGRIEENASLCDVAIDALRRTDLTAPLAFALAVQAAVIATGGDLVRTRTLVLEATELIAGGVEMPRLTMHLAVPAMLVGIRSHEPELLREFAREEIVEWAFASQDVVLISTTCAAYAEFLVAEGRGDDAAATIGRALAVLPSIGAAPWLAALAAVHGTRADAARAAELLDRWAAPRDNAIGRAYREFVQALTMRRNRSGSARAAAESAADAFRRAGLRYLEAQAVELAGDVAAARAAYTEMGALRDVERLSGVMRSTRSDVSALSDRERQIAELVAEGRQNKEIGAALNISARTVETHLTSIYGKLGVSSRLELARLTDSKTLK